MCGPQRCVCWWPQQTTVCLLVPEKDPSKVGGELIPTLQAGGLYVSGFQLCRPQAGMCTLLYVCVHF